MYQTPVPLCSVGAGCIWFKQACVNGMVVDNAYLHKFGVFRCRIRQDLRAALWLDKQRLSSHSLTPWECPTTTPCSGMPDSDTNGS
jgi:hypothetical protein